MPSNFFNFIFDYFFLKFYNLYEMKSFKKIKTKFIFYIPGINFYNVNCYLKFIYQVLINFK